MHPVQIREMQQQQLAQVASISLPRYNRPPQIQPPIYNNYLPFSLLKSPNTTSLYLHHDSFSGDFLAGPTHPKDPGDPLEEDETHLVTIMMTMKLLMVNMMVMVMPMMAREAINAKKSQIYGHFPGPKLDVYVVDGGFYPIGHLVCVRQSMVVVENHDGRDNA